MLLQITKAEYVGDFLCELTFNDGRLGLADIRMLADDEPRKIFAPLADEGFARQFELQHGTLCWPGEIDVAPEYLYFMVFQDDPALYERFVAWGYLQHRAHA